MALLVGVVDFLVPVTGADVVAVSDPHAAGDAALSAHGAEGFVAGQMKLPTALSFELPTLTPSHRRWPR
jgi:hypothetical protein